MQKYTLFQRIILLLIIVAGYFFVLRPSRAFLNQKVFVPVVQHNLDVSQYNLSNSVSSILIWGIEKKKSQLKFPFGVYFLMGLVGLVLVSAAPKFFLYLVSVHVVGGMISYVALWGGVLFDESFFILPDLLSRYLVPILSFLLIPLSMGFASRRKTQEG